MKQIQIGICDDEKFFLEELYNLVYTCGNDNKFDLAIDAQLSVKELLRKIETEEKEYDILFLDIDMPEMTGVDAAKTLRKHGYKGVICFVTSHNAYALDAYGVEALDYLIKPARYEDVKRLMKKAVFQIAYMYNEQEAAKRYLEVNTQKAVMQIDMERILYLEKRRNQCVIHMEDGEVVCYETLKSVFPRLNQSKFCYSHQGYIVNFDKVMEVLPEFIAFGLGREAPVSRKYYKRLRDRKLEEIHAFRDGLSCSLSNKQNGV